MTLDVSKLMVEEVVNCDRFWDIELAVANALSTYDDPDARRAASRALRTLADEAEKLSEALRR